MVFLHTTTKRASRRKPVGRSPILLLEIRIKFRLVLYSLNNPWYVYPIVCAVLCSSKGILDVLHRGEPAVTIVCMPMFFFSILSSFFPLSRLFLFSCSRQSLMPTLSHPWFLYWQQLSLISRKKQHGLYPMPHLVAHMNRSSRFCTTWKL